MSAAVGKTLMQMFVPSCECCDMSIAYCIGDASMKRALVEVANKTALGISYVNITIM
jgi:hypothetical protein